MISFQLDDEQQLMQDTARKLAADKLWARIRETEAQRALPDDLVTEAHELGLTTVDLPESAGGHGLGRLARCLVEEQLAWGDVGACYALGGPGALGPVVRELGTEAQRDAVLKRFTEPGAAARRGAVAFSEAAPCPRPGLSTTATRDGDHWILTGTKAFVVNGGIADRYVVVAQIEPDAGWRGLGTFVVEGDAAGIEASSRRRLLGIDAAWVADVRFDGVRVPEAARLSGCDDVSAALVRAFAHQALVVAARAVGVAARAWEQTHQYTSDRHAFGKPIGHFQAVAFTVADRLMDVDGARWMLWRAAAQWDREGAPDLALVGGAAAQALEGCMRCGDDGVQLHGGAGFIRDYPVEKLFRDARQLSLMGPTVATLDQMAADAELGVSSDPAAVLPTSDIQPVCI